MRHSHKRSVGSIIFDNLNVLFMLILMVVMLYPMVNIIAMSMSDAQSVARMDVTFYPMGLHFQNYIHVLNDRFVFLGYRNTIFYAAAATIVMLATTSLMAYPLTVPGFPITKFITVFLTITMFFSGGLIPYFLLMRDLGLRNTIWIMILPGSVGAFNVFMFRTFFKNIPDELKESAKLDGANEIVILLRIILPLSKALLATFALFRIVGVWNDWFTAAIFLDDREMYPLQNVLRDYLFQLNTDAMRQRAGVGAAAMQHGQQTFDFKGVQMAMIVVSMLPVMMIYPFLQKYFVKGVMIGAIKG